ncbi:Bgt-972 [Blumeria graminis f. sp. tritici]|uniref:serine C-palmitoyltransferase n=2 Tax=Blumeria graminis f. sp. tritici TaxID=62690 RepID=A0A381LC35_BLUGR|nr:Component of serine palmitoyltransferase [Blumeria graminis f. sp. tritici 96224]VDB89075.1 Bgt-972 [Blumeria graminis f. sp. tritici]
MDLQDAQQFLARCVNDITTTFQKVPGSAILIRYIQSSYQHDPVRSAIELILVIFFVRYLLAPSYPTHNGNFVKLTEEEIDDLVEEWIPEPIVAPQTPFEEAESDKLPVIVGPTGPRVKLQNGRTVINLASYNFYNFVSNEIIKEKAIQTLRTYGVGPCGPPQFYGTQDVHMKTEAEIATCLGTQGCIVYAQAFSTISSVIPAFCKRGDTIVADRAVNYAIRKGLQISRSTIRYYEHNNMEDLERVLQKVVKEQAKKPLTRRFIVTEGLSEIIGDCVDLPKLIELKLRYKFRLMLDETWSFGVVGRTGRGLTESQNVDASQIDMLIGSLAGPLCAGGGFCAGSTDVVEHQRISAASYTFSAALPAILATTATETLNMLQTNPEILSQCRENIKAMRAQLDPRSDWVQCASYIDNPIVFLVIKPDIVNSRRLGVEEQDRILQECIDESMTSGVLITRTKTMPLSPRNNSKDSDWKIQPALKVCITTGLTKKETEKAGVVIRHAITKVMTKKNSSRLSPPAVL